MISQVDTWIHLFVFKFNFLGLLRQLLQGRILHKKVHSQFSKFCLLCVGISEPCWLVHRCAVLVDCYCVRGLRKTTHLTSHLGFEISFIFTLSWLPLLSSIKTLNAIIIIIIVMWLWSCIGSFWYHCQSVFVSNVAEITKVFFEKSERNILNRKTKIDWLSKLSSESWRQFLKNLQNCSRNPKGLKIRFFNMCTMKHDHLMVLTSIQWYNVIKTITPRSVYGDFLTTM